MKKSFIPLIGKKQEETIRQEVEKRTKYIEEVVDSILCFLKEKEVNVSDAALALEVSSKRIQEKANERLKPVMDETTKLSLSDLI